MNFLATIGLFSIFFFIGKIAHHFWNRAIEAIHALGSFDNFIANFYTIADLTAKAEWHNGRAEKIGKIAEHFLMLFLWGWALVCMAVLIAVIANFVDRIQGIERTIMLILVLSPLAGLFIGIPFKICATYHEQARDAYCKAIAERKRLEMSQPHQ